MERQEILLLAIINQITIYNSTNTILNIVCVFIFIILIIKYIFDLHK